MVNDTIQGTVPGTLLGVEVALYTPPAGLGHPAACCSVPATPDKYLYHFRPDLPAVDYSDDPASLRHGPRQGHLDVHLRRRRNGVR